MLQETVKYRGCSIQVRLDSDPENPRKDYDHITEMICAHRRYDLGDRQAIMSQAEIQSYVSGGVYLPIYLMDHSGLALSTSPFSCSWDSGQVGWIAMTGKVMLENFGGLSMEHKGKAIAALKADVEVYDNWQRGSVYGYVAVDHLGNDIGSCWGFYPDSGKSDHPEHMIEEAKGEIDAYLNGLKVQLDLGWHRLTLAEEDGDTEVVEAYISSRGGGVLSDRDGRRYVPYVLAPEGEPDSGEIEVSGPNAYMAVDLKGDISRVVKAELFVAT